MSLLTAVLSGNSDISNLIRDFSSPNISFANFLAINVLPTPVFPTHKNDAIHLLVPSPTRPRLRALQIVSIASFCPITSVLSLSLISANFFLSSALNLLIGIPVFKEITFKIVSVVINDGFLAAFLSLSFFFCVYSLSRFFKTTSSSSNFLKFSLFFSISIWLFVSSIFLRSSTSSGFDLTLVLTIEPASSIISIAESGRFLSVIYFSER